MYSVEFVKILGDEPVGNKKPLLVLNSVTESAGKLAAQITLLYVLEILKSVGWLVCKGLAFEAFIFFFQKKSNLNLSCVCNLYLFKTKRKQVK